MNGALLTFVSCCLLIIERNLALGLVSTCTFLGLLNIWRAPPFQQSDTLVVSIKLIQIPGNSKFIYPNNLEFRNLLDCKREKRLLSKGSVWSFETTMVLFRKNNRIWQLGFVWKASHVACLQIRWQNKRISTECFSWIEN